MPSSLKNLKFLKQKNWKSLVKSKNTIIIISLKCKHQKQVFQLLLFNKAILSIVLTNFHS